MLEAHLEIKQIGSVSYMEGFHISQPINALKKLAEVIKDFDTIIEIGYYKGGLTYWLFKNKKDSAEVFSYDISDANRDCHEAGINFLTKDCFLSEEEISRLIIRDGKTLIFCDGGFKNKEFNTFSKYLKTGDVIMLHDYHDDEQPEPYNSFDDSCGWVYPAESNFSSIKGAVLEYGLEKFKYEDFRRVLIGSFVKK
jgi:hypothetical protein